MAYNCLVHSIHVSANRSGKVGTVRLRSTKSVCVPPNQIIVVDGELSSSPSRHECTVLIETSSKQQLPRELVVESSVVTVSKGVGQRVPIALKNSASYPVYIPKKTILGDAYSCAVGGSLQANAQNTCRNSSENKRSDASATDSQLDFSDSPASSEDIKSVREVLEDFPQAFSVSDFDLGHSRIVEHTIELTDPQPFRERYRRIPPALYNEVRDHLDTMKRAGVIRESYSPYSSPVVLVRKKDGSLSILCRLS